MLGPMGRAAAFAAALLATGCAELGTHPEPVPSNSPQAVVAGVLDTLRADDAARRRGLAEARAAQRAAPDAPAPRARLGLLLALLPAPLADAAEAEALLAPLAAPRDGPWAGLATFALTGIGERRALEARARAADTRAAEAERSAARLEERARQAEARAADTERKLEAMKAIERRALEREAPRDVRRR